MSRLFLVDAIFDNDEQCTLVVDSEKRLPLVLNDELYKPQVNHMVVANSKYVCLMTHADNLQILNNIFRGWGSMI